MDDFLGCLLWIIWWPYHWWRDRNGREFTAPMDDEAERIWWKFAIAGTCLVVLLVMAGLVWAALG